MVLSGDHPVAQTSGAAEQQGGWSGSLTALPDLTGQLSELPRAPAAAESQRLPLFPFSPGASGLPRSLRGPFGPVLFLGSEKPLARSL